MTVYAVETNPVDFHDFEALYRLLFTAFAYMEDRVDPPSSLGRMSVADLRRKSEVEDIFVIRDAGALIGCLFGTARTDGYYIGKLAVAASQRGLGFARALVEAAAIRARALGLPALVLQSRIELVENHAAFAAMGFVVTTATAHPGYDRPTSLTFRRML